MILHAKGEFPHKVCQIDITLHSEHVTITLEYHIISGSIMPYPFFFKLLCSNSLARKTRNITRESFYVPLCSSQNNIN